MAMECAPAFWRGSVRNLVIPLDLLPAHILIKGRGLGTRLVCKRGACARAVPTHTRQHPCRIHKPVLGTRDSGTVHKNCTNHDITVQLHIDDAILCIMDDVMIVLY